MGGGKGGGNMPSDKQMTTLGGPWFPLQGAYKDLIDQIGKNGQDNWEYGPGVVSGFTPEQQQAVNTGMQMGLTGSPWFQGATNYAGGIASGGNVGTSAGSGAVSNVANNGVNNPVYDSLLKNLQMAEQGSGGLDYARDVAGGKYLDNNPYIDKIISSSMEDVNNTLTPQLESRMSMAGRLGSNAEAMGQGQIAKQLGNVATGVRFDNYNTERDRQQAAGLALPSLLGQEVGTRGAAANAVSGDVYSRIAQQLGAAGQANSMQNNDIQTALGAGNNLGANFNNQFLGLDRTLQYGGAQQGQTERENAEAQDKFRFDQGGDFDRINRMLQQYGAIAGTTNPGAAAGYATQTMGGPSDFQVGLGNLLGVAGTAAGIGGMFMNPMGAASGMGNMMMRSASPNASFAPSYSQAGGALNPYNMMYGRV